MIRHRGFNLVEILITLSIVALLTTLILSAVSDYRDKLRIVRVRNDLAVLAQVCKYIESTDSSVVLTTVAEPGSVITSIVAGYLLSLPTEDPWGRMYWIHPETGMVETTNSDGFAYIVDAGMGRIISPGPDGVCHTTIGHGVADHHRDIVIQYRRTPWLFYAVNDGIFLAQSDGSSDPIEVFSGRNVALNATRDRFVCLDTNGRVVWGNVEANAVTTASQASALEHGDFGLRPFWAPDGVHVIVACRLGAIWVINTATQSERRVTPVGVISGGSGNAWQQDTSTAMRSIHTDENVAWFHHYGLEEGNATYITVSSDGKIAYYDARPWHQGISMVLLDGSGRRTIIRDPDSPNTPVPGEDEPVRRYRPLFWHDTENIVYIDRHHHFVSRVKLDGSFNINLHGDSTGGQILGVMPSPDRSMMVFRRVDGSRAYTLRLDGSGFLHAYGDEAQSHYSTFFDASLTRAAPLWRQAQDRVFFPAYRDDEAIMRKRYDSFQQGYGFALIDFAPDNEKTGLRPSSWDIDQSGHLIAVISEGGDEDDGVFVYSINGPHGAITRIGDEISISGSHSIFWLD